MRRLSLLIFASSLAVLSLATGCGSSDPPPTKAQFLKQADRVCQKGEEKRATALEEFTLKSGAGSKNPLTPAQAEFQMVGVLLPPVREMTQQVGELEAPDGEDAKVEAIVKGMERAVKRQEGESKHMRQLAEAGKRPAVITDPFRPVAELAGKYGFKTCFLNY
jgi:hypothetical protein